jgi:hypothetical protein
VTQRYLSVGFAGVSRLGFLPRIAFSIIADAVPADVAAPGPTCTGMRTV